MFEDYVEIGRRMAATGPLDEPRWWICPNPGCDYGSFTADRELKCARCSPGGSTWRGRRGGGVPPALPSLSRRWGSVRGGVGRGSLPPARVEYEAIPLQPIECQIGPFGGEPGDPDAPGGRVGAAQAASRRRPAGPAWQPAAFSSAGPT
jgi:hypothetical protein